MSKILLITNTDMSLQSGNVVLINRRAEEIYREFQLETLCLVVANSHSKSIDHKVTGIEYVYIKKMKEIKEFILKEKPKKIILYGLKTYLYIFFIKQLLNTLEEKVELLLDVQGAIEERIEYSKGIKRISNYPKYLIQKIVFSNAINRVDGAFVVSDELKDYCYSAVRSKKKQSFTIYKIRCGINEVITTDFKLRWRKSYRNSWGISDETIVMSFSGYRMAWQNIDRIIEVFKRYDKLYSNMFFTFFCNIDDEFIEQIERSFPKGNYIVKFLSFEEYFEHLCACDVGFIVRDYNVTNNVAFPNKFSDYLNAGLMISLNKALPEPYRMISQSGIEFCDVDLDNIPVSMEIIKKRQNKIKEYYLKSEKICSEELLYTTQVKKLLF